MKLAYTGMAIATLANAFAASTEEVAAWAAENGISVADHLSEQAANAVNELLDDKERTPAYAIGTVESFDEFAPDGYREPTAELSALKDRAAKEACNVCRGLGEDVTAFRRGYRFIILRKHAEADKIAQARAEGFIESYSALARHECVGQRNMPNAANAKWANMSSRRTYSRPRTSTGPRRTYTNTRRSSWA